MRIIFFAAVLVWHVATIFGQTNPYAPDVPEPGSVEKIREYTTGPEYLPRTVAYLPDSPSVPSPTEVLGRLVGTPNELSKVAEIHGYFRRLDAASSRVRVEAIGRSEEGREMLLATISDEENLQNIDRYREITRKLGDPRATRREEAERLAAEGKVIYQLIGGLHSPETGSPEMLMELAYRLAVSEKPEIQAIRRNVIVLITPVAEPDGRDRQVEWYYRHLRNRRLAWEELREFGSPPYWGKYVYHDNNRDGMQLTLALTRAIHDAYWDYHPQVVHDLHESVPLLYISSGHGPYSRAVDPVSINEWTQFAHHEAGALQSLGLPGVWTWGFWDGWWPGYLLSLANNHHSVGRFYETFGNSMAGTFERKLEDSKFVGHPVTEVQWYRPWPPEKKVKWSLRNNTNFMQAGVLEALKYAADHSTELLRNFWVKGDRALSRGKSEAPYAWIFPEKQRDPNRLTYLINQLLRQRIEVHRLGEEFKAAEETYRSGSYVVRMDQPYRNAAINFLEKQNFPEDEPNQPYDDVAWSWPLLYGVDGKKIDEGKVLDARMTPVVKPIAIPGTIEGSGEVLVVADTGQNALLEARLELPGRIEAAEEEFTVGDTRFPSGSWILGAPRARVAEAASRLGLRVSAVSSVPNVKRHSVELPRLAVMHTWSTQDAGWVRYTFDQIRLPYTLINPDEIRRGNLRARFDVIIFPDSGGDFARMVHGIDTKYGPLAYTRTAEFPSHGFPDSSPDLTGGMGFSGVANLQQFIRDGGVFVALANAGTLAVDGGLVRGVSRAQGSFSTPGSELLAKVVSPRHPIAYGYEEFTSVFRGNDPLFDVRERDRDRVVLQFGSKKVEIEKGGKELSQQEPSAPVTEMGEPAPDQPLPTSEVTETPPAVEGEKKDKNAEQKELVLSGFIKGKDIVDGKPAILDMPVGRGRVVIFNFNPLHRYLNQSDFRFLYNVILNWNDLP